MLLPNAALAPILAIWMTFGLIPNEQGTSSVRNPTGYRYRLDAIWRTLFRWVMRFGKKLVAEKRMKPWLWNLFRNSAHCIYGVMTCATGIRHVIATQDKEEWHFVKKLGKAKLLLLLVDNTLRIDTE